MYSPAYDQIGFKPRHHQQFIDDSAARFTVLVCHRRFGKTVLTVARLLRECLESERDNCRVGYFAPYANMAQRISWDYALQFADHIEGAKVNKINRWIDFPNGSRFSIGGADNVDAVRGQYFDYVALDEPGYMRPRFWSMCVRPALADRNGRAIFLGTPHGRSNLLWNVWNQAQGDEEWARFMFKASETKILPDKELKAMRKDMSLPEYQQELECDFTASVRGSYLGEDMAALERAGEINKAVRYDPSRPVHIGMCTGDTQENGCWIFQYDDEQTANFLRYVSYPRKSAPEIVKAWRSLPYKVWGKVVIPKAYQGGNSRADRMRDLDIKVIEPESRPFDDMIEEGRHYVPRSRFHSEDCKEGIESLRQYRQRWDDKAQAFTKFPVKDWTLPAADAFLNIAICHRQLNKHGFVVDYSLMDRAVCRI